MFEFIDEVTLNISLHYVRDCFVVSQDCCIRQSAIPLNEAGSRRLIGLKGITEVGYRFIRTMIPECSPLHERSQQLVRVIGIRTIWLEFKIASSEHLTVILRTILILRSRLLLPYLLFFPLVDGGGG